MCADISLPKSINEEELRDNCWGIGSWYLWILNFKGRCLTNSDLENRFYVNWNFQAIYDGSSKDYLKYLIACSSGRTYFIWEDLNDKIYGLDLWEKVYSN